MLSTWIRWLAFVIGALIALGGFAAALGDGSNVAVGVEAIGLGAGLMVAAVLQRSRYRSGHAERQHDDPGPGGGEDGLLEPRFLPTTEIFVAPTSHRLMRVFTDPRTGERRYRAEG